jgi:hypothetical protein
MHGFAGAVAAAPGAGTLAERRALLREANAAIEAQVRGYYGRPWADGDADAAERGFLCECGNCGCRALVELADGTFADLAMRPPGSVTAHERDDLDEQD